MTSKPASSKVSHLCGASVKHKITLAELGFSAHTWPLHKKKRKTNIGSKSITIAGAKSFRKIVKKLSLKLIN